MRPIPRALALLALFHPGCGEPAGRQASARYGTVTESSVASDSAPSPTAGAFLATESAGDPMMMMMGAAPAPAMPPQDAAPPDVAIARRIIYDAQIELLIEDLDPVADRVVALVERHQGYIAEQDLAGSPGSRRSGRWRLRVPVERFEDFVGEVLGLGELVRNQRTSQDVTDQFYDVEANIRNKRVEEATILKILEERGGKLEDVLKVEVELSRVRGEIERLEGRLRVLDSLSSLATVTLSLRERERYAPAAPVVPDFRTRVVRAWASSVEDLRRRGENLVVGLADLAPRLPPILIALAAAWLTARWLARRLVRALPRLREAARRPITPPRSSG